MLFFNLHTPWCFDALPWITSRKMLKLPSYITSDKINLLAPKDIYIYIVQHS